MRIAYLVHFYPPSACGGAGYYTAALAEELQKAGHDVGVLCVDRWGQGDHYLNGYTDETHNGVPVRRFYVNWQKAPKPFDWLYDSPVLGSQTRLYLEQFRPDVVHVSSCYTLSARPVFVAKSMSIPIVMHLHDYWAICPRVTLLHKGNNTVCSGPENAWKCQRCLLSGTRIWQLSSRLFSESLCRSVYGLLAGIPWFCRHRGLRGMLGNLERRRQFVLQSTTVADVLITPTKFAKVQLETHGVQPGRISVMPYGNRLDWRKQLRRTPSDRLRIGFLGNVIPTKGVHVLVDAYSKVRHVGRVSLEIWGNTDPRLKYRPFLP